MDESRKKADWPFVAGLVIVGGTFLVVPAIYAGGYFRMGHSFEAFDSQTNQPVTVRWYEDAEWKARLYEPAAKIESWLTGKGVVTAGD